MTTLLQRTRALAGRSLAALCAVLSTLPASAQSEGRQTVRVFVFAGQSNMVGADSKASDIARFPPFAGLDRPQPDVRFHYCLGREDKTRSGGWVPLAPIRNMVGPELSFAATVKRHVDAPLAIIKVAAGGTHLGGDWNPDDPSGFELYPLALREVREALDALERDGVRYRLEGFVWHQGENDMFDEGYRAHYGANLARFFARWREDLGVPDLHFYVGELCTKTIWGMDLRPRMHDISVGQRAATAADPHAEYVPTSHVGVEIGGGVGLHYHYGTLGQLEHGVSHAEAYLRNVGALPARTRELERWPYGDGGKVRLFVLAGHRNMEGERAFVQELVGIRGAEELARDDQRVAYRYDVGGHYRVSDGWEPLGPVGYHDTFGPELSFAARLREGGVERIAVAKYTHSGSQVIDWTPEGSVATTRNLFEDFVAFVRSSVDQLEARGHEVELAGIFYHLGENDMSWMPFRRAAAARLAALVEGSREGLGRPGLRWYVSQQEPTDDERVRDFDPVAAVKAVADADPDLVHVEAFGLPGREKKLVLSTAGIVRLGEVLAEAFLAESGGD